MVLPVAAEPPKWYSMYCEEGTSQVDPLSMLYMSWPLAPTATIYVEPKLAAPSNWPENAVALMVHVFVPLNVYMSPFWPNAHPWVESVIATPRRLSVAPPVDCVAHVVPL